MPHVESGLFTFIGATTENPSFEVNSALLSRAAVYVLQPLNQDDLRLIVERAQAIGAVPAVEPNAMARLLSYADGDARRLLNTLETLAMAAAREKIDPVLVAPMLPVAPLVPMSVPGLAGAAPVEPGAPEVPVLLSPVLGLPVALPAPMVPVPVPVPAPVPPSP